MKKHVKLLLFIFSLAFFVSQTMPVMAANPKMSRSKLSLIPGETYTLSVKNTSSSVKWSSSKKKVAKVNSKGKVTAVSPGKATITAKVGGKKYKCVVQVQKTVDIIVFAGQSNMTGVGNAFSAPKLTHGAGYAYNYVTARKKFTVLKEPFGFGQDDSYFYNGDYCRGSMVTAFVNAYYQQTKTPVIAVPASCVGSGSVSWKDTRYKGVTKRLNAAVKLVKKKKMKVGHVYLVWMQGENDAFADMSASMHKENLQSMYKKIKKKTPVEQCLIISIANYTKPNDFDLTKKFKRIQNAQKALCKSSNDFTLISTKATKLSDAYFQEDGLHIIQQGLNTIGKSAGRAAGKYANSH
nr:Ig-like domain-containing protein [Lachnospiraceae bacterium]